MEQHYTIWSYNPPNEWKEGLPIGNGRLAAMVWGDEEDIISLNHEKLWRGLNRERDNDKVPEGVLGQIRELIEREKFFKATVLANGWFGGEGAGISRCSNRIDAYQPAGDLLFCLSDAKGYRKRQLDLMTATALVERETNFDSRVFMTSYADVNKDVLICKWYSDDCFSGKLRYIRPEDTDAKEVCKYTADDIFYECVFDGGISYKTRVRVKTNGKKYVDESGILISEATELLAIVDIVTFEDEPGDYPQICEYDYAVNSIRHMNAFQKEMEKFKLEIDTQICNKPTDERLIALRDGGLDDDLILLFYNYGRYLFLASNICAELPANLQGKWNYEVKAPWGSDYHLNINLQMNYWLAEPLGMGDHADCLFHFVDSMIPHAKKAAKDLYGCRGVWMPHATDVWGRSTPESFGFCVWAGAAPWLAWHYWQHYIYSGDRKFLEEHAYPFFKEIALFYEDYVVKDEEGIYQIMPSQSPENAIQGVGIFPVSIGKSSAMDVQLAYDVLGYAIKSAEILDTDVGEVQHWRQIRENLPEFKIGKDGRLLEWDQEREEKEPAHRHLSHLYGLYPSELFADEKRPAQYAAVKKSLDYRMAQGGGMTGWSRAWVACLYARLGEKDKVYEHVSRMISDFATASLLDLHPPKIFQIDGNFGAVAAVTEAIAQYRGDKLYLLHALPDRWHTGEMCGLKTPGGHTVDFTWNEGKLSEIKVMIGFGEKLTISINGEEMIFEGKYGEVFCYRTGGYN